MSHTRVVKTIYLQSKSKVAYDKRFPDPHKVENLESHIGLRSSFICVVVGAGSIWQVIRWSERLNISDIQVSV